MKQRDDVSQCLPACGVLERLLRERVGVCGYHGSHHQDSHTGGRPARLYGYPGDGFADILMVLAVAEKREV